MGIMAYSLVWVMQDLYHQRRYSYGGILSRITIMIPDVETIVTFFYNKVVRTTLAPKLPRTFLPVFWFGGFRIGF